MSKILARARALASNVADKGRSLTDAFEQKSGEMWEEAEIKTDVQVERTLTWSERMQLQVEALKARMRR